MGHDTFKDFTYHQDALKSCQFTYFHCGDELIANATVTVSRTQQHVDFKENKNV